MDNSVSVFDVAKYILNEVGTMTTMKLQKLCYYSQAWYSAEKKAPLFAEDFFAWKNGPICYPLYLKHRGRYSFAADSLEVGDSSLIQGPIKDSIDETLDAYKGMSAAQLSELTHSEDPWINAWENAANSRSADDLISTDSMMAFYSRIAADSSSTDVSDIEWPDWMSPEGP